MCWREAVLSCAGCCGDLRPVLLKMEIIGLVEGATMGLVEGVSLGPGLFAVRPDSASSSTTVSACSLKHRKKLERLVAMKRGG
jgi:hypothetical protein